MHFMLEDATGAASRGIDEVEELRDMAWVYVPRFAYNIWF